MSGTVRVELADLRVGADRLADAGRRCDRIHLDALPRDAGTFGFDVLATAVRAFASEVDERTAALARDVADAGTTLRATADAYAAVDERTATTLSRLSTHLTAVAR